jgi:hypothetical protein
VKQPLTTDLAAQYEQLRSDVLSSPVSRGHGLGLGVFLRQGMLGWMRAWSRCTDGPPPRPSPPPQTDTTLPLEIRSQMTIVLAAMIVGQQQEVFRER